MENAFPGINTDRSNDMSENGDHGKGSKVSLLLPQGADNLRADGGS